MELFCLETQQVRVWTDLRTQCIESCAAAAHQITWGWVLMGQALVKGRGEARPPPCSRRLPP